MLRRRPRLQLLCGWPSAAGLRGPHIGTLIALWPFVRHGCSKRSTKGGKPGRPYGALPSVSRGGVLKGDGSPWKVRAHQPRGRRGPPRRWLVLKESLGGDNSPQRVQVHEPGGTGSSAQAVVGTLGGPVGGSSSQWPGHTSRGERGAPPRLWAVLEEGLLGIVAPCGPRTPARG